MELLSKLPWAEWGLPSLIIGALMWLLWNNSRQVADNFKSMHNTTMKHMDKVYEAHVAERDRERLSRDARDKALEDSLRDLTRELRK